MPPLPNFNKTKINYIKREGTAHEEWHCLQHLLPQQKKKGSSVIGSQLRGQAFWLSQLRTLYVVFAVQCTALHCTAVEIHNGSGVCIKLWEDAMFSPKGQFHSDWLQHTKSILIRVFPFWFSPCHQVILTTMVMSEYSWRWLKWMEITWN